MRVKALPVDLLATAIRLAAAEHGRPNSFSCGELRQLYRGPRAMTAGRIGKRRLDALWKALGGSQAWGSCPVYDGGRFYV